MSVTYKALFLLAIITGGECARVHFSTEQFKGAMDASSFAEWFQGGNEVCRSPEIEDKEAMTARWIAKANKMKALAASISKKGCLLTCPLKHKALGQRIKMWDSCFEIPQKEDGSFAIDNQYLFGSGSNSLQAIFRDINGNMMKWMQKRNLFKAEVEGCNVDFAKVDLKSAIQAGEQEVRAKVGAPNATMDAKAAAMYASVEATAAIKAVRKQLYGESCDYNKIKEYWHKMSQTDKFVGDALVQYDNRLLKAIINMKTKQNEGATISETYKATMASVLQDSDLPAGVPSTSDELEQDELEAVSDSLAELNEDLDEALGAGTGGALAAIIVLLVIGLIILMAVCWKGHFGFSSGKGGASFSGSGSFSSCFS